MQQVEVLENKVINVEEALMETCSNSDKLSASSEKSQNTQRM